MGFCAFGSIGDCGSEASATMTTINSSASSVINDMFTGQVQSSSSTVSVSNLLELVAAGDISLEGIDVTQENVVTVDLQSWQGLQNSTEIQNKLEEAIDAAMSASISAESDLFANPANAELVSQVTNIMKSEITTKVKVEQITECISSAAAKNTISLKSGGNIVITNSTFTQRNLIDAAANCVMNTMSEAVADNESISSIISQINANLAAEQQGIFNTISDIFGSLTTIAIVIGAIIILAILGFLVFIFFRRRKGKAPQVPKQVKQITKNVTKTVEQTAGYLYNMVGGAKMSKLTIFGIALGSLIILGLFIWAIWYFFIRKKKSENEVPQEETTTPTTCSSLMAELENIREEIKKLESNPDNWETIRDLKLRQGNIETLVVSMNCTP